ncbi:MAG: Rieske 2Fe-2S domain-containing protein [Elusimicrobia bacterium]|nr:Rieske 2Fe-2S domain-containing protein [Elusimicrobiota bacterium]
MNRRQFIDLIIGGGALGCLASAVYPVLRYMLPPEQVEAEPDSLKVGAIKDFPAGSSKIVKFGRKPVIVIRDLKGGFHALAATCTHLDCIVQYQKDNDIVWCACHNGKYDLSGKNVSGPPPRPLDRLEVKVAGDDVTVVKTA